jgi:hypothetical protein
VVLFIGHSCDGWTLFEVVVVAEIIVSRVKIIIKNKNIYMGLETHLEPLSLVGYYGGRHCRSCDGGVRGPTFGHI